MFNDTFDVTTFVEPSYSNVFSFLTFQTVRHNAYHEDPYAKEFGIRISERLASVEARILPAPWVLYLYPFTICSFNFILPPL